MEENMIFQYFEGRTIFVTGATGFLAKVFLEKILRIQPNIKQVYILIREKANISIEQRLHDEILNTDLFQVLKEGWESTDFSELVLTKIIPVAGEICHEHLGVTDSELRNKMWQQIDIIIHSAATTKFDERYDVALSINVFGVMNVQNFARKCVKLKTLLHVSTAFVHGSRMGLKEEKPFKMGDTLPGAKISYLDITTEKRMVEEHLLHFEAQNSTQNEIKAAMKDLGLKRAMLHGWLNTYIYTKAMGEMLFDDFEQKDKVLIFRPTIITSTYKEPFPGWIEGLRTIDVFFKYYGQGLMKFFPADPASNMDMIPVDMVVNSMTAAIAMKKIWPSKQLLIYQVGSSLRNPITCKEFRGIMYRYIHNNPFIDHRGKPIIVRRTLRLLSSDSNLNADTIHSMVGFKVLKLLNLILCNRLKKTCDIATRRMNSIKRIAIYYKPFTFIQGSFDDANTECLRRSIIGSRENGMFCIDPTYIEWEEYFLKTHFPGVVEHALNK